MPVSNAKQNEPFQMKNGESIWYFSGEKWHVLECKCGERIHFQPMTFNDPDRFNGPAWTEEWEFINGSWRCWKCLGKPKPQVTIEFENWLEKAALAAKPANG